MFSKISAGRHRTELCVRVRIVKSYTRLHLKKGQFNVFVLKLDESTKLT